MPVPIPTPIYRFIHIENLRVCIQRGGLYSPNHTPNDGAKYRTIHSVEVQEKRHLKQISCGPCGVMHDYVSFYFGYLSPMLLQLKSGKVEGYNEGQEPLIYLVSTAQAIKESGLGLVFSDGHGLGRISEWFDDLNDLDKVDWDMVHQRYWHDELEDNDRQRRKQAEFLVHKKCPWKLIHEIAVHDHRIKRRAEAIMGEFPQSQRRPVRVRQGWYYY